MGCILYWVEVSIINNMFEIKIKTPKSSIPPNKRETEVVDLVLGLA